MSTESRNNSVLDQLMENKAIVMAILLLCLCFGMMDNVVLLINKTLLLITNIERNVWVDVFFFLLSLWACIKLWRSWIKNGKIVAPRAVGHIVFPVTLYLYFRFSKNSPYKFVSYLNGPITYLDIFAFIGVVILGIFIYQKFKRACGQVDNSGYQFDLDAPIRHLDKDLFNLGSLVNRIVNYIASTDVQDAAFSMGLVGEWGDGKTSLMNLIEEKIREDHRDFIIVHFSPRASKKADFIQEDFLEALKHSLVPLHSGIERTIDKYAVALDAIPGIPPLILKSLELLHIQPDKERDIKRNDLKNAIIDINRRIVVLIDDLDRLTGEELMEVLKVLDTNGAFPNMVFVTSFDKDYVNSVLVKYLQLGNQSRDYTDKYFPVEIRIPLHPSFRLLNYLVKLLTDASKKGIIKLRADQVEDQTRKQAAFIQKRLLTIRDIKRFANLFLYDYSEVQNDVDYRDFFLLELIKYAHPEDYRAIHRFWYIHRGQISMLTPSSEDLFYLSDVLLPKKNQAGEMIKGPTLKPRCLDILKELFPEEPNYHSWYARRYKRIYCVSSFEHYFYNYEYSHLKASDIEQLYNAVTFSDTRNLIDKWGGISKDLETYVLTYEIDSIKSKDVLCRFMHILLYTAHKYPSINYAGQYYSFIRKENVEKIILNCGFLSMDKYKTWFKESMAELAEISPVIPSNYLRTPIGSFFSQDHALDYFIYSLKDFQDYALELLADYLQKVNGKDWDVDTAYEMAQIQNDAQGAILPAASQMLHDTMLANFSSFSASFPRFIKDYRGTSVGYTAKFRFNSVFKDKEEFDHFINAEENDKAPEIALIRAIWPLFKANDYTIVTLPEGISEKEAKKTYLREALKELNKYESIEKALNSLAEEWKNGHKLSDVNSFIDQAKTIWADLIAITLKLEKGERIKISIQEMINQFQEYANTARILKIDDLRVGDIVRIKKTVYEKRLKEHPDNMIYEDNNFTIMSIGGPGNIMTIESSLPLTVNDIEAVLIDGIEDANVYYKPKNLMSIYAAPGEPAPARKTDYGYFIEQFKLCFDEKNKSYYDLINEQGFQFVHEVQHWLNDAMHGEGLDVNHSIRKELRLYP